MPTPPPTAAPTTPDPGQDRAGARAETPGRAARLLTLIRKLIDYGKEIAHSLQQKAVDPDPFFLAPKFGTADLALILARVTRGLRLAAGLEARLISHPPQEKPPIPAGAPPSAAPPRPPHTAPPAPRRARLAEDPRLAALPSAEEIAAECRRRPVGAVLADICRDLGIYPAHPLWRELNLAIMQTGGNATAVLVEMFRRRRRWFVNSRFARLSCALPPMPPGWKPPPPLSTMDWETGPP
jgi:hypothetical protein